MKKTLRLLSQRKCPLAEFGILLDKKMVYGPIIASEIEKSSPKMINLNNMSCYHKELLTECLEKNPNKMLFSIKKPQLLCVSESYATIYEPLPDDIITPENNDDLRHCMESILCNNPSTQLKNK